VKRLAFALAAPATTSIFGTRAAGQPFPVSRATRRKSATHVILSLALATFFFCLSFLLFFCSLAVAQRQPFDQQAAELKLPDAPEPTLSATAGPQHKTTYGTVSGTVVDQTGKGVAGADVTLTHEVCLLGLSTS
jgi:hypothetical protein